METTSKMVQIINESRSKETDAQVELLINMLKEEGLTVEFGNIGTRSTWALIHNEDYSVELVGYSFVKDLKYYRQNVGHLKALQQALARKQISDNKGI